VLEVNENGKVVKIEFEPGGSIFKGVRYVVGVS